MGSPIKGRGKRKKYLCLQKNTFFRLSLRLSYPHQSPIGFKQLFGIKGLSIFDNSERSLGQFVA